MDLSRPLSGLPLFMTRLQSSRLLKYTSWALMIVFLIIVLLRIILAGPIGRQIIEHQLESRTFSGQSISIEDLQGDIFGKFKIGRIRIHDTEGEWLNASQIELSWSPLSILNKTIHVSNASAQSVNVLRQPALTQATTNSSSSSDQNSLIRHARIEFANLQNINIHEDTGFPKSLHNITFTTNLGHVSGNLKLNSSSVGLSENGNTVGIDSEEINIDLDWNPQTLLTGNVDIQIAQNGFIAHLLPTSLDADLRLNFTGQGDRKNWDSHANLKYGDKTIASMNGVSQNANAHINMITDFENFPLTPVITERLGTTLELDVQADLTELKNADLEIAFISRMLDFKTSGSANMRKLETLDSWEISANAHSLSHISGIPNFEAKTSLFEGNWSYAGQKLALNGEATAQNLRYEDQSVQSLKAKLAIEYANNITEFSIASDIDTPRFNNARLNQLIGNKLNIATKGCADLSSSDFSINQLNFRAEKIDGSGTFSQNSTGRINASILTNVIEVGALLPQLNGDVALSSTIDQQNRDAPITINTAIQNAKLSSSNSYVSAFLNKPASFNSITSIDSEGKIDITASINAGKNTATLSGYIEEDYLDATLQASLPIYTAEKLNAQRIEFKATANGPLHSLQIQSDLSSSAAIISQFDFDQIEIKSLGQYSNGQLSTTIDYKGNANEQPFAGRTIFSFNDAIEVQQVSLDWADLTLRANGSYSSSTSPMANIELTGDLNVLGIDGSIKASSKLSEEGINFKASGTNIKIGQTVLTNPNLTASGKTENFDFNFSAKGITNLAGVETPLNIEIDGSADRRNTEQSIVFDLVGLIDDERFNSNEAISFLAKDGKLSAKADLSVLGGNLVFHGNKSETSVGSNLTFTDLALNRVARLLGRDGLTGNISGSAQWDGQDTNATGTYLVDLTNAGRENDSIAHINTSITGEFIEGRLVSVLEAHNGSDLNIDAVFSFPAIVENGIPSLDTENVARLDVGALGKLEAAWALIGLDSVDLNGFFNLYAEAEAPLLDLKPIGEIQVSEAAFEHERYGSRMENVQASASFDTESIQIISANADGIDGGHVEGTGQLYWSSEEKSALNVQFNNFGAIKQSGLQANLTGEMDVSRVQQGLLIAGDLEVNEAHINIAQFESTGIKTIDVIFKDEIIDPDNIPKRISPTSKMALDLSVEADRKMFVTGRGIDIELSADMQIEGTLKTPDVRGAANIVRGDFSLLGQPFEFSNGVVRVDGNPLEATTDLKADRTSDGVTSSINVSGTLRSPNISFSSTPSLPEDEIISRLLFGRAPTQLSPFEAAQLALAATDMTSNGEGFTPLADIQNAFGLDRLSISQDAQSNPQLETGKYLAEDVYVELRSRANGQADLAVEWEAIDDVEVATVFGNETGARVSVQWKKELD